MMENGPGPNMPQVCVSSRDGLLVPSSQPIEPKWRTLSAPLHPRHVGKDDLLGLRQSGVNLEGLVDPERDLHLMLEARDLFQERPDLAAHYARAATETA